MMVDQIRTTRFAIGRATAAVTAVIAAGCLLLLASLPGWFEPAEAAWRAVGAAMIVVYAGAILGLLPVVILGPLGVMGAVFGYFIGMGLRVAATVVGLVLAVRGYHVAAGPLAVALAGLYLPVLAVEATMVGLYLWRKDQRGGRASREVPA